MKLKIVLCLILLLMFPLVMFAGDIQFKKLEAAYQRGEVTLDELMLNKFYYIFEPQKLSKKYFSEKLTPLKCGTMTIKNYFALKNRLKAETIRIIESYLQKTEARESTYISPMKYFKISYTTTGSNAVPSDDNDGDGIPDFVEWIADYLDTSWDVLINQCGFAAPVDNNGDGYYNISFENMNSYGYTTPQGVDGNEGTRIVLHNNFLSFPPNQDPEGNQKGSAKVTCAHEFKHASQYIHSQWSESGWIELDAAWVEELVFDYVNDTMLNFTGYEDPFSHPHWAIDHGGTGSYEDYFWQDFLHQKFDNNSYHSAPIILAFWQRRESNPNESVLTTYDNVLQQMGSSLEDAFVEYVVWNYYTGSRAILDAQGNSLFGYDEAGINGFPESNLQATHNTYPVNSSGSGVEHLAAHHIRLNPGGEEALKVMFNGQNNVSLSAVLSWTDGNRVIWEEVPLDEANDGFMSEWTKRFGALLFVVTQQTGINFSYSYQIDAPPWVSLAFTNKIDQQNAGGTLLLLEDPQNPIPSGSNKNVYEGVGYTVNTQNERFLNWTANDDYKHHDWNEVSQEYLLQHYFKALAGNNQDANFLQMHPVTIKNVLIYADDATDGHIAFHDPWYVDANDNQPDDFITWSSPHYPKGKFGETTGGVFLEQGWPDWQPPYYSVKAEAQQTFTAHGQSITGYFLGWEGTDVTFQHADQQETPLVFHADGAEARAVYKGHLASSIFRATGYNNGRRLCKTNDGKLHLVYEDDNTIWYTFSTNNGQTWAKEYAISPRPYSANFIDHTFKNPSIATDGAKLYVVFEEVVQSNSATNHLIDFRKRENNSWRPIENISDGSWQGDWWNGPWSERPSVGANEYGDVLVSWRDKTNGKIKMRYYNNGSWSSVRQIYANGYPEAICMPGENEYPLKLVFSENGLIKYVSARYFNGYWTVSSVQNLSGYAPPMFADHANPSASVDRYGHGYIAWEAMDQSMDEKHILYQKFNFTHYASSASSVYSLSLSMDANLKNASLSYEQSSHYISVFFQDHDQIKRKRTSGSSWYLSSYGSGKYPNICPNKSIGAVWTTYTSAPYLLKTENLSGWLAKSTLAETEPFKRFYYSKNDSGYFTVDLKDFTVDGQKLVFYQNLNSDTIEINGLTDFTYQLQIGENCQAGILLSFWFVTDEQKYFLDEVELSGDEANTVIERHLSLDPVKPSKGYVLIEFSDNEPFVINVVPDMGNGSLAKNVTPQAATFVPQKFALKQNFPNPFNPVTQIQFDLPQAARVTLKVFDLSGHEVATLVNGYRSAGRYSVAFDGSHLASGMYIYRLTTDKGFAQSKKMMLIK
ncbi:MXAN_6640 family putative metalloprotease [Calditrichota bacterium GD2]